MQSVSSSIWTRVAMSISYDNNHYTTGTSYLYYGYTTLIEASSHMTTQSVVDRRELCITESVYAIMA